MTVLEIAAFGSLNLEIDPQELGFSGAVDAANVDFDKQGRLRTRDGYVVWSTTNTTAITTLHPFYDPGGAVLMAGTGTSLIAYSPIGVAGLTQAVAATPSGFASFGSPLITVLYVAVAGQALWRYYYAGFSQPAGMPTCTCLAVQSPDNRLVVGNIAGTGQSRVRFSKAGDPEDWTASNTVELTPGDTGQVTALVAWRDQVYAFKNDKYFVFTGNSVAGDGTSVFNYRPVDFGVGANTSLAGAVAGDEGVYFINQRGVYVTNGLGAPTKVSAPIDSWFLGTTGPYWTGDALSGIDTARLAYVNGRLLVSVTTTNGRRMWVYDPKRSTWTYWTLPVTAICGFRAAGGYSPDQLYMGLTGSLRVNVSSPARTSDNGTAIAWQYRTGYANPGTPGGETVMRQWLVDGTGSVSVGVGVNDAVSTGTSAALNFSASVSQQRFRNAKRGRNFSLLLSGTGPGVVERAIGLTIGQRSPVVRTA